MKSKEEILANIFNDLNINEKNWTISIDGNQIIAYWKWKDGIFFSPDSITDEVKEYKFIVTLLDNGKWKETDVTNNTSEGISLSSGKASFNKSFFVGNKKEKSFEISFGKKRDEDNIGIQKITFDTDLIKQPIRNYLKQCGWKKKGFF